jgi:hypothetical protein
MIQDRSQFSHANNSTTRGRFLIKLIAVYSVARRKAAMKCKITYTHLEEALGYSYSADIRGLDREKLMCDIQYSNITSREMEQRN